MSYSILVDLNDNSASCQGTHHSDNIFTSSNSNNNNQSKRYSPHPLVQTFLGLIGLISRAIYFRRLKLLKFYMATALLLFLIFLLVRPKTLAPEQQHVVNNDHVLIEHKQKEHIPTSHINFRPSEFGPNKHDHLFENSLEPIKAGDARPTVDADTILTGHFVYPNNLSYTLSMKDFSQIENQNVMQVRIREATKHSWDNYKKYAWGYDMLKPRSKEPDHWFHLGLNIVDSVDTLIMMGLKHEANSALDWMENELKFITSSENSNCFELTIRILGGILSAYHLTARERLRQQAISMGDVLLHCFDTESRIIPYSDIDLSTHRAHPPPWNPHSSLSEVASLQLEFRFLTQISGNKSYEDTTFQTSQHIHNLTTLRRRKLLPMYINPSSGQLEESIITMGARSDSYYEYLLKQYLQTGIRWLEADYLDAMDEVKSTLFRHTNGPENYTYVAEVQIFKTTNETEDIKYYNKMDHLVCFLPGTLALGYYHFSPEASKYRGKYNLDTPINRLNHRYDDHLEMAEQLARTCYHMYSNMGTGLSPEIATFVHREADDPKVEKQPELQAQSNEAFNILRPEFVESLFYLYHITGKQSYRDQAVHIFEAFEKYSRISSGYSAVSDVRTKPPEGSDIDELLHRHAPDRMESFWISETLKYLYLTFCDDRRIVGTLLNHYIFNTEGHMIPIVQ